MMKLLQFKKTAILVSTFFLSLTFINDSYSQNLLWTKKIGGSAEEFGRSVTADAAGNIYTTGYYRGTVDFDPGVGTYTLTSTGDFDIYVTKLDFNGDFAWAKSFGSAGSNDDQAFTINLDASGNVYTTGYFRNTADFDPGAGTFTLTASGLRDVFVSKLDASGNFVWAKKLGGTGDDIGYSVNVDASGNVYTCGYFNGTADFDPSATTNTLTTSGGNEIFISKLDANGNYVWAKHMGSSGGDVATCLTLDATANVYIGGYYQGIADLDPSATTYTVANAGSGDIFIAKLDVLGNFVWAKTIGGTGFDRIEAITLDASNNVHTTGYFTTTVDFDPGAASYTLSAAGSDDVFVSKLDASGNFVWARKMGGTGSETGYAINVDASGNVYTAGQFYGTADFDPGAGTSNYSSIAGNYDLFLSKLDVSGNFVWAKSMGGSGDEFGYGLTLDAAGDAYMTGYFSGVADFDPNAGVFNLTSNTGSIDAFLIKLGSSTTGISESATNMNAMLYPNPASILLNIKTDEKLQIVSIYNALGKLVQTETEHSFSVKELSSGIYMLQITTEKGTTTLRFIKE